jgi:hypothetical protein
MESYKIKGFMAHFSINIQDDQINEDEMDAACPILRFIR